MWQVIILSIAHELVGRESTETRRILVALDKAAQRCGTSTDQPTRHHGSLTVQ